jgi:Nucleotidyltransferase of unknown function (DUF6036)
VRREELAHILRAAARIADDPGILVIGSQAILGTFWEDELPQEAWLSVEADIAFLDDPQAAKADKVDGAIGELSQFHETYTYYAQGVEVATAVLPGGWRQRLVRFDSSAASPAAAVCLDRHDLVVSKLVARREKDYRFAAALISAGLVDVATLLERAALLPDEHGVARAAALDWLHAHHNPGGRPA